MYESINQTFHNYALNIYAKKGESNVFDVVISHYNCHDGISAAWVIYNHQREIKKPRFIYINPSQHLTKTEIRSLYKKRVIMVDVSFTTHFSNFLNEKVCEHLVVLDHHLGISHNVINYQNGIFDNTRCGAMMAWNYFYGNTFPPQFINFNPLKVIDFYDRFTHQWKINLDNTQECLEGIRVSNYFDSVEDFDLFISNVMNDPDGMKNQMIGIGSVVVKIRDQAIRESEKRATHMIYKNKDSIEYKLMMVSIDPIYRSQCGSIIAERNPDSIVVIYRYSANDDRWFMSARSSINSNVTSLQLAKEFGGNGHEHAAGFTLNGSESFSKYFKKMNEEVVNDEIPDLVI